MKLEKYLADRRISLKEFAHSIGLSHEGARLIVRGQRFPRRATLERIQEVTGGKVKANDFVASAE